MIQQLHDWQAVLFVTGDAASFQVKIGKILSLDEVRGVEICAFQGPLPEDHQMSDIEIECTKGIMFRVGALLGLRMSVMKSNEFYFSDETAWMEPRHLVARVRLFPVTLGLDVTQSTFVPGSIGIVLDALVFE
jgi:hypothetical protein